MAQDTVHARQTFTVERTPGHALDSAEAYLEGAGLIAPPLAGVVERHGDRIVVHHGRLRTQIDAKRQGIGAKVTVQRAGQAPLMESRRALILMGLIGTVVAWALAVYNDQAAQLVSPIVTLGIFFTALVAVVAVLYIVDRSVERQVDHLLSSMEDAVRGDPILVLTREMQGLERKAAIVNGLLFYCAAMILEFILFTILLSEGVREGINEAVTLEVMQRGFLLPVLPSVLFGVLHMAFMRRLHNQRIELVATRFPRGRPHPRSARP